MGEEKEKIKWNAAKPRYEMKEGMEQTEEDNEIRNALKEGMV